MSDPTLKSLSERLADIRQRFVSGETPREIIDVLDANVARLLKERVTEQARKVDDVISMAEQVQTEHESWALQALSGEQFLVLTWFRGNW